MPIGILNAPKHNFYKVGGASLDENMRIKLSHACIAVSLIILYLIRQELFFIPLLLMNLIPGFLLSYSLKRKEGFLTRILLSFGLSTLLLFVVYAFSDFGWSLSKMVLLAIFVVFPAALFVAKRQYTLFLEEFKLFNETSDLLAVLLIFLVIVLSHSFLLDVNNLNVSQTDGVNEVWYLQTIREPLISDGKIYLWNEYALLGYPQFLFETFFSIFKYGINAYLLGGTHAVLVQKAIILLHFFILLSGLYLLNRKLSLKAHQAFLSSLILVIMPPFVDIFVNGRFRNFMALAFVPIFLIYLHDLISKKEKNYLLLGLCLLVVAFHHPITGVFLALLGVFAVMYSTLLKLVLINDFDKRKLLVDLLIVAVIPLFWVISFIVNKGYMWQDGGGSGFLGWLSEASWLYKYNISLDSVLPKLIYLVPILLLINIVYLIREKKNKDNLFQLTFLLGIITIFLMYSIPLFNFITKYLQVYNAKFAGFYIFILVVGILKFIDSISSKSFKRLSYLVIVLFLLIGLVSVNKTLSSRGLTETIFANDYVISTAEVIKGREAGRIFSYGLFHMAYDPILHLYSGMSTVSYGQWFASHINIHKFIRTDDGSSRAFRVINDNMVVPLNNATYTLNMLRNAFTKYVYFFRCDDYRRGDISEAVLANPGFPLLANDSCTSIHYVKDSYFVDLPEPSALSYAETYNQPDGYKYEPGITSAQKYASLDYKRVSSVRIEVLGSLVKGNIVRVKEQYYPNWVAYSNGKKLPVRKSAFGTILIDITEPTDKVELMYKHTSFQRILLVLSCVIILLIFIKDEIFYTLFGIAPGPSKLSSKPAHRSRRRASKS